MGRIFLVLTVGLILTTFFIKSQAAHNGVLQLYYTGDEGTRAIESVYFALNGDSYNEMSKAQYWLDIHPPFDKIYRGTILKGIYFLEMRFITLIEWAQHFANFQFLLLLSAFAIFFSASWGWPHAFWPVVLLAGSQAFSHVGVRIIGENNAGLFYGLSLLSLSRVFFSQSSLPMDKERFWILLSAALMLVTTLFRSEAVLTLPGICLCLWIFRTFKLAFLYGLVASIYTVGKIVIAKLFFPEVVQYTGAKKVWNYASYSFSDFLRTPYIQEFFLRDFHLILSCVFFVFILFLVWISITKRPFLFRQGLWIMLACALSYFLSVSTLAMSGHTLTQRRMIIFFCIPWAIFLGVFFKKIFAKEKVWIKTISVLAAVLLCSQAFSNVSLILDEQKKMLPKDIPVLQKWIETNISYDKKIAFDYLYYWEWILRAHFAEFRKMDDMCAYQGCPLLISPSEEEALKKKIEVTWPGISEQNAIDHLRMHQFFLKNQPLYFVGLDKKEGQKMASVHKGMSLYSFVKSYPLVSQTKDEEVYELPYLEGIQIAITPIVEFSPYQVYLLTIKNPEKNASRK
ncbi:MAG: hypothetical protein AB7O96_15355 [Pseudobdellovibrionaceae bacterium]